MEEKYDRRKKLFERLRKLESRYRPSYAESEKADLKSVSYEVGFADGVNQAMNEIRLSK
ncbi:MAG: hypothetical protein ACOCRK_10160 [bacterium]